MECSIAHLYGREGTEPQVALNICAALDVYDPEGHGRHAGAFLSTGRKSPVGETPVGDVGVAKDPEKHQVGVERKKGTLVLHLARPVLCSLHQRKGAVLEEPATVGCSRAQCSELRAGMLGCWEWKGCFPDWKQLWPLALRKGESCVLLV